MVSENFLPIAENYPCRFCIADARNNSFQYRGVEGRGGGMSINWCHDYRDFLVLY